MGTIKFKLPQENNKLLFVMVFQHSNRNLTETGYVLFNSVSSPLICISCCKNLTWISHHRDSQQLESTLYQASLTTLSLSLLKGSLRVLWAPLCTCLKPWAETISRLISLLFATLVSRSATDLTKLSKLTGR